MSTRKAFLLACACAIGWISRAQAAFDLCDVYREAYGREIKAKIQAGIPFELMSAVFDGDHLIEKKAVRITYNLWDETVTVKDGDKTAGVFPITKGEGQLCRSLAPDLAALAIGHRYHYRLLLNPMWGERMARLQVSAGVESTQMAGVDWKKIAQEMPSESVLVEKELDR